MQIVARNAELEVKNSDPILHNIHSFQEGRTILNIAEPKQGMVVGEEDEQGGRRVTQVRSTTSMRGALFVAENPYAVLTDAEGK